MIDIREVDERLENLGFDRLYAGELLQLMTGYNASRFVERDDKFYTLVFSIAYGHVWFEVK